MSERLITHVLNESPFILLTLSVALVGYFRSTPISLLVKQLKKYEYKIKKLTNNSAEKIEVTDEVKELNDKKEKVTINL